MSLTLILLSLAAGPSIFWALTRKPSSPRYVMVLWLTSALLAVVALSLPFLLGDSMAVALAVLLLLWMGWIMVVTLCYLAVMTQLTGRLSTRIAFTLGAVATTLPWFGLTAAEVMMSS